MTRTERASYPRALARDRSLPRTGFGTRIPKNGAGAYSWGSLSDEAEIEFAALNDEELEFENSRGTSLEPVHRERLKKRLSAPASKEEVESALQFRKNALKSEGADLVAIARTSAAVSSSPPNKVIPVVQDIKSAI